MVLSYTGYVSPYTYYECPGNLAWSDRDINRALLRVNGQLFTKGSMVFNLTWNLQAPQVAHNSQSIPPSSMQPWTPCKQPLNHQLPRLWLKTGRPLTSMTPGTSRCFSTP